MNSIALRLLGSAASTVDHAFVAAFQMRNRKVRKGPESLSHQERMRSLGEIRAAYGAPELISDPDAFFVPPPVARTPERSEGRGGLHEQRVRALRWGGECIRLSWESAFEPYHARVRDAYLAHALNRTAHARLYRCRASARPAVILLHGYMAGHWAIEERIWPVRWMNRRGLDVAIPVLPFHGVRGRSDGGAPPFPGADPRFTNEGFRQVVSDLRVLIAYLRERGAPAVGVMGMSLGGYSTALLATLQRDLAFAVPLIPLASLADFARDQGRLGTGDHAAAQHAALEAANWVVSPLARPSLIASDRVIIVSAEADRVTPLAHGERLAAHFGAPLLRLPGGHLLQMWRTPAFRAVKTMLQRSGIL
jgi:pimeloyl-ACP methyl ester carboxylesterase